MHTQFVAVIWTNDQTKQGQMTKRKTPYKPRKLFWCIDVPQRLLNANTSKLRAKNKGCFVCTPLRVVAYLIWLLQIALLLGLPLQGSLMFCDNGTRHNQCR